MDFKTFKILHSETICFCQILENDLKWIYTFMHKGDKNKIRDSLEGKNLGQIIQMLKKLDNEDDDLLISNDDYNFLKQMKNKRNYWTHQSYIDFVYAEGFINSKEYIHVCEKLQRDHDRLQIVYKNVEQLKLRAKEIYTPTY
ncbi:MAG: hypothetical protein NC310_08775 [Roseburia sp.]|nr:hypothetical protein [Anaeroplasma bactoclasticum]MCM1197141.1 hypothetical protein [Roseburia sp.]MCM1557521.1 hypothetical protein [Anaeroplasma bactoclasticum]